MTEDRILLEGMVFFGRHGALAAERELGQRFVVDLVLHCDLRPAGMSDELTKTVHYGEVHRLTRDIVEGAPFALIESVAERIADAVLGRYPRVEAVRVKVAKPQAPLGDAVLAGSAVEIVRYQTS